MEVKWHFISGILFLNFFISLLLALRSWRRRAQGGQGYFALLMLAAGCYSLLFGFEILLQSNLLKIFFLKLENIGIVAIAPFWFLFAFEYTQNARWFQKKYIPLFFIIPCISLLILASPFDHLYYASMDAHSVGPVVVSGGIWYWVQTAYNYFLLLLGAFVILRAIFRYPGIYRSQSLVLLSGLLIPLFANGYYLFGNELFPQSYIPLDGTPIAFIFTGILYGFGIFQLKFLDLAPIAREIVFESIPEMVLVLDSSDRIVDINQVGVDWLGTYQKKVMGHSVEDVLPGLMTVLAKYGAMKNINEEIKITGASPRDLELNITPLTDREGQFAGRVVLAHDVTSRNRTIELINQRDDLIRLQSTALDAAANAVVISDLDGRCIWANRAFSNISGYSFEEALGRNLSFLKSGIQDQDFYKELWETIVSGKTWHGEIVNKHKLGNLFVEEMTISPVYNDKGVMTNYIAVKQDITIRKRMELDLQAANELMKTQMQEIVSLQDKLREQAIRDPLTDLYNRRILQEAIEREIAQSQRNQKEFCVVMIDVDNFKQLNDRYGHTAGDMVLKSLARILENNTRGGDISCRYGGEEFAILLPNCTIEGARKRALQWRRAFQVLHKSFNGQDLQATLSMGIAVHPGHGEDAESIIDAADKALYTSKGKGKNQVTVFEEE